MSQWVSAILTDEKGKVCGTVGDESLGRAFRRGWNLLVAKMSVENPPALTLTLSTEHTVGHTFGTGRPVMREFGSFEIKATHTVESRKASRCVCDICGWDEAKRHTTMLGVADPFGFRFIEPDIESLVADEAEVFYAPHPQVKVECEMCVALREKGINPVTMRPE